LTDVTVDDSDIITSDNDLGLMICLDGSVQAGAEVEKIDNSDCISADAISGCEIEVGQYAEALVCDGVEEDSTGIDASLDDSVPGNDIDAVDEGRYADALICDSVEDDSAWINVALVLKQV
ncbi:MAG: hypothetical protein GY806_19000, partial [Gammaproteobacteria bacterium]|nr:hypothetical protein [Gammaproteobacteria bacterium]